MQQDKEDGKSSDQEETEGRFTHIQPLSPPQSLKIVFNEDELITTFYSHGVTYKPNAFQQEMQITVQEMTTNYEIANLTVSYGHFEALFKIINVDLDNPCTILPQAFVGSFGQVYKTETKTMPVAIKCIKIKDQKFQSTFRQAIKQYLFLTIASALKAGPKIAKIFSFDMVLFKDCLVFSMEFCEMNNYRINKTLDLLKNKLSLLHAFNIVHLDIKPENIAYCPTYNQYVFIDFGLSRIIKEGKGQKSLSSFSGSFNYCSPEMLELYVKDSLGMVDLYSNDVQCLRKTVEHLQNILPDGSEEYQWRNNPILTKFNECQALLMIKFAIYEFSFTINNNLQILEKYRSFIISKKQVLARFILTLPQSLRLLLFCKTELKIDAIFSSNEALEDKTKGQTVPQRNGSPILFFKRCSLMQRACKCTYSRERLQIDMKIEQSVLFDAENVKNFRLSLYKLALIKLIKINGSTEALESKVKACKIYLCLHGHVLPETKEDVQIYRMTVSHIFLTTLNNKQAEKFQILKNVINTIVILEIVNEEVFTDAYESIFYMDLSLVQKLRLAFKFIASLQFVRQKYRKEYNYQKLTEVFFHRLSWFLQLQQEDKLSINMADVIRRLKILVQLKILEEPPRNDFLQFSKARRSRNDEYQLFLLNDHIQYYITSEMTLEEIDKYNLFNKHYLRDLMEFIEKPNSKHHLTYSHLTLYFAYHQTNNPSLGNVIYQTFIRQLRDHPEHKFFTIYLLNKLNKFKEAYSIKLLIDRLEINKSSLRVDDSHVDFEEIFSILDYTVKNLNRFHSYIGYLLAISAIQSSQACAERMALLIQKNKNKIFQLSNYKHANKYRFHNNQLRNEILILNNLSLFSNALTADEDQRMRIIYSLMKNCQRAVEDHPCVDCKVSGLFEINHIYSNYLCNKGLIEESFWHLFEMVAFSLKEVAINIVPFMVHFVRRWVKHEFLYDKYDLRPFIYQYVTDFKRQYYCLLDVREYNIFLHIYLYIVENYTEFELAEFIESIIEVFPLQKAVNLINNFYYSILCIIDAIKQEEEQRVSFKLFHGRIINRLLYSQRIRHNPFKALYFMPLLQVRIKTGIEPKMLKVITFSFDRLDRYTRDILISKYYEYVAYYMDVPFRKHLLLRQKHLKQETRPMPLKKLLRCKLGLQKIRQGNESYNMFRMLLERYHRNIGNVS